MIEFQVRSKKMTIGKNKGKIVYYAYPKAKQNLTNKIRVMVTSKMIENEIDVCAETLKRPKIVFTPKQQMREAAKNVELSVDNPKRKKKKEEGKQPGGGGTQHP